MCMRVLYLTNLPAPYKVDFFRIFSDMDVDLTVLYERSMASDRKKEWFSRHDINFKEIVLKGIYVGREDAFCLSVLSYIDKSKFDVFIINGYTTPTSILAIISLKLRHIDYYLAIDGALYKPEGKIKSMLKRTLIKGAKGYFSPSKECDQCLKRYDVKKRNCIRYPFTSLSLSDVCEAVLSKQQKEYYKNRLGFQSKYMILGVGQFIKRKGFDILLESALYLSEKIDIVLVGSQIIPNEYNEIINHLNYKDNIHFHFVPFRSKEDLDMYYRAADIFVLPTHEDIWGLVINEALAHALPVITTKTCGAGNELIRNGYNGFILNENSPQELGKKIKYLLDESEQRERLSFNAIESIKDYTLENMANIYKASL